MHPDRHEGIEARSGGEGKEASSTAHAHPHSLPPSLVLTPCLRAFVPLSAAHHGAPSHAIPAERTHRIVAALASSASWRSAFPPPIQNPQNEVMCHPVPPAKTRQNPPKPAQTRHDSPYAKRTHPFCLPPTAYRLLLPRRSITIAFHCSISRYPYAGGLYGAPGSSPLISPPSSRYAL
jgi:hypothetical protein